MIILYVFSYFLWKIDLSFSFFSKKIVLKFTQKLILSIEYLHVF